jgi:hypothetical protein
MDSCSVSQHFTCEGDPQGYQRRVDMDEQGVTYYGIIDAETQWIESHHVLSEHSESLAPNPADPASATDLMARGADAWDFTTDSAELGPTRYTGEDRLTGETATVDGVTLDRTQFQLTARNANGKEVWRSTGNEYFSREWRMFLSGVSTTTLPDGTTYTDDSTPKEIIRPGERGFLSVHPKYGCNEVMSSYDAPAMTPIPGGQG